MAKRPENESGAPAEDRLRRLAERNRLILEAAGEGVYGLDGEGLTTFVNPAAARMLGWEADELVGEPMHSLLHHTRADGSHFPREECPIYAAFKDGEVHTVADEVFWRRDGSSFPVEYTSTPIVENGALCGAVVVFRDVTQRREAEARLRAALDEVEALKNRLQEQNVYLRQEIREERDFDEIIGESPEMRRVTRAIDTVAPTDANVLITGETGTGKELVARAVHERSSRAGQPLIKVNCASIPRELFESEFFGHVRGSFTGALKDRVGRFQLAHRGTLFLDEIGEVPLEMQGKLLRVLQEGEFERVGDEKTRTSDVRLVAATNRDLGREIEGGRFRQDLFYRLNVFPIEIPPLRRRRGDVPLLARHFLARAARRMNRPRLELSSEQARRLERQDWPGNARELQNLMERAVIVSGDGTLHLDLPASTLPARAATLDSPPRTAAAAAAATPKPKPTSPESTERGADPEILSDAEMKRRERENILAALERTDWRVYGDGGAAELLGVKPTTLASRIKKLGLSRAD